MEFSLEKRNVKYFKIIVRFCFMLVVFSFWYCISFMRSSSLDLALLVITRQITYWFLVAFAVVF